MRLVALDRGLGGLLVIGSLLHAAGSLRAYASEPTTLVWALSASLAGLLLAAVNIVRANRGHDAALAWICIVGCAGWIGQAFAFGVTIGNPLDPRVLIHAGNAAALVVFAGMSLRRPMRA
jgi:hypothetical protein